MYGKMDGLQINGLFVRVSFVVFIPIYVVIFLVFIVLFVLVLFPSETINVYRVHGLKKC